MGARGNGVLHSTAVASGHGFHRVLSSPLLESSFARNRTYEEMKTVTLTQCEKYLPMHSSTATSQELDTERRRDHVGHFVLRLAFCRS